MLSCLIAAALWAVALSMFRDPIRKLGADTVNLFKCLGGGLCFLAVSLLLFPGQWGGSPTDLSLLAVSGVVGMSIGDVLLFVSVRRIGVQRSLILFNTAPVITGLAAMPIYGESLAAESWAGIVAILAGVSLVESDPVRRGREPKKSLRAHWLAILPGLGAAAGQSAGILLARGPLQRVEVLPASSLRLSAAAIVLLAVLLATARGRRRLAGLRPARWPRLLAPTFLGTVMAVFFMMRGIRDVPAGISAALLSTTPIFSLPIARYALGEAIGPRSVLGTLVCVAGVTLLGVTL